MKQALARRNIAATLLLAAASFALAGGALAATESHAPAPVVAQASQSAPRLVMEQPDAAALARGLVFLRYRTENIRVLPVFGPAALAVSPRIGHLHITVDDAPWHWADVSGEPVIVQGLQAGPHKILIELADTNHQILDRVTVEVVIPQKAAAHQH